MRNRQLALLYSCSKLKLCIDHDYYNNPDSKELPNMCIVTLSVLNRCRHELATIDDCKKAFEKLEEKNITNDDEDESPTPGQTCTESLGWLIYKTLDVGLTCQHR